MPNPVRLDPTRTTMQRQAFIAAIQSRLRRIRAAVVALVETEDAFGLASRLRMFTPMQTSATTSPTPVINSRWAFATDDKKVEAYQEWLKGEVDKQLLTVDPANKNQPWVQPYIGRAYQKGIARAYTDVTKGRTQDKSLDFIEGGKEAFLKMAFEGPIGQTKLRTLSTRAFSQLKGITADMDKEMTRILAQGLAQGKSPRDLGRLLAKSVDGLGKKRATTIARTEIVHAHNEGQLDSFEAMNLEGVGVQAEWSTAHDGKVCPMCAPLEGIVLTIKEARGLLPRHPNCRCAWIPADVGEREHGGTVETTWAGKEQGLEAPGTLPTGETTGQTWDRETIEVRIRASLKAEKPGLSGMDARRASKWAGADVRVVGKAGEKLEKEMRDYVMKKAGMEEAEAAAMSAKQIADLYKQIKESLEPVPGHFNFKPGSDPKEALEHFSKFTHWVDAEKALQIEIEFAGAKAGLAYPKNFVRLGTPEALRLRAAQEQLRLDRKRHVEAALELPAVQRAKPTVRAITTKDGPKSGSVPTKAQLKDAADALAWASRFVSKDVEKAPMVAFEFSSGRAYYSDIRLLANAMPGTNNGKIRANGQKQSTILHEWGHHLEETNPELAKAAQAFLARRTAGEKAQRMQKLSPGQGYKKEEIAKPDEFEKRGGSHYMGKIYTMPSAGTYFRHKPGETYATEIVTMGLERMVRDPHEFAKNDADYFTFIWDVMHGKYK